MLKTKRQTIKFSKIMSEGNNYYKKHGYFFVCIKLVDNRVIHIKSESGKRYAIYLIEDFNKNGVQGILTITKTDDLRSGLQKFFLDWKYKIAII